jgi:ABC-2 type transport system ATP-binding protein
MRAIEVSNLTKVFVTARRHGGLAGAFRGLFRPETVEVRAVESVSFALEEGELVGFLGPNGAGKTTTLKMLAGLLYPTAGDARVLGFTPWQRKNALRCQIALVMGQKNQLWWDLPARDSLALNREIYGIPFDRWKRTVDEMTEMLEVGHRLEVQVRELSLGERMKFELIASLLHEPKVLFLDEPTIGLDVVSQQRIRDFLRGYNAKRRTTILLTSHNMSDIKGLANRILLINHGRIMHDGPLASLIQRWSGTKRIRLTASRDLARAELEGCGEVVSVEGPTASLRVPRDRAAAATGELLARLPVIDLEVEDPPIEEVIAEVFREQGPPGKNPP